MSIDFETACARLDKAQIIEPYRRTALALCPLSTRGALHTVVVARAEDGGATFSCVKHTHAEIARALSKARRAFVA